MAPSDYRPSFRLPWQSGSGAAAEPSVSSSSFRAPSWPSRDLAGHEPAGEAAIAPIASSQTNSRTKETSEQGGGTRTSNRGVDTAGWRPSGADPASEGTSASHDVGSGPATESPAQPGAADSGPSDTAGIPNTHLSPTEPHAPAAAEGRTRKPTKFLADLTRAMRQAADEARQSAIAQFQADVTRHIEASRAAADAAAGEAQRRTDDDVAALREWSKTEIARIKQETEDGTAARRTRLEGELADQTGLLQQELDRVQGRVQAFESEMDQFFQRLHQEDDPGAFAGLAEQLPEPPSFEAWRVPATTGTDADGTPVTLTGHTATDAATAAGTQESVGDTPVEGENGALPAMLPGDFAAAEAAAASWDGAEPSETDRAAAADDGAETGAPWPPVTGVETAATEATRTSVAIVGLVSVASIATFKRLLSRVPGVQNVQVASGPDGEFLFKTSHDGTLDVAAAVAGIQGFGVQVTETGTGFVNARAVDPEVV